MSASAGHGMSAGAQTRPFGTEPRPRLKVEQVSYAYSATGRSAPKFILGPVTFEAQQRELPRNGAVDVEAKEKTPRSGDYR